MKNIEYDMVFCSPLKRAKQTMEIVNVKNKEVIYDSSIMERNAFKNECVSRDLVDLDSYWNYNCKYEDFNSAEKLSDCFKRVYEFLDEVKRKYSDKNVLVVCHNGICRLINCYVKGIPQNGDLKIYNQNNAELKSYEI